jgi:hypothetical protein
MGENGLFIGVDYSWCREMRCDEGLAHLRLNGDALAWCTQS